MKKIIFGCFFLFVLMNGTVLAEDKEIKINGEPSIENGDLFLKQKLASNIPTGLSAQDALTLIFHPGEKKVIEKKTPEFHFGFPITLTRVEETREVSYKNAKAGKTPWTLGKVKIKRIPADRNTNWFFTAFYLGLPLLLILAISIINQKKSLGDKRLLIFYAIINVGVLLGWLVLPEINKLFSHKEVDFWSNVLIMAFWGAVAGELAGKKIGLISGMLMGAIFGTLISEGNYWMMIGCLCFIVTSCLASYLIAKVINIAFFKKRRKTAYTH